LAKVYRKIQAIEYDAKWVKQAKEDLLTGHPNLRYRLKERWMKYTDFQETHEKDLRGEIVELLKEKWWNT